MIDLRRLETTSDWLGQWARGTEYEAAANRVRCGIEVEIDQRRTAAGSLNRRASILAELLDIEPAGIEPTEEA